MTSQESHSERGSSRYDGQKIVEALDRTGFLLEHDVYSLLRNRGHNAFIGSLFLDTEEDKYREIDVSTRDPQKHGILEDLSHISFWSTLLIECKNFKAPLVVIGRSRAQTRLIRTFTEFAASREVVEHANNRERQVGLGVALGVRGLPASPEMSSFIGNQIVRLDQRGSNFTASNEGMMESLLVPLTKAMRAEQRELAGGPSDPRRPISVVLSFPVILTSKPVFEADVSGGEPHVREVPWTTLFRRYHRRRQDDAAMPESILIDVVSRDGLTEYLGARVDAFTRQVSRALQGSPHLWMPVR